jgi:hypothetical protein
LTKALAGFSGAFIPPRHCRSAKEKPRREAGVKNTRNALSSDRSELPILLKHLAAGTADMPAVGGKRRATTKEVAKSHSAGVVTQPRRSRFAWSELGQIDGACGCGPSADKKACGYGQFHRNVPSIFVGKGRVLTRYRAKSQLFVRRTIARLTPQGTQSTY